MDQRVVVGGVLAILTLAVLALGLLIAQDTSVDEALPEPKPVPASPAPPKPPPPGVRIPLPPPPSVEAPDLPADRPPPADVTSDDRREMNYAVDDVLKVARDECILPYLNTLDRPVNAEFVFDAVLYDGQLFDVGLRSLTVPIPEETVSCIADAAWYADWPGWEIQGELRLQRSIEYPNALAMP